MTSLDPKSTRQTVNLLRLLLRLESHSLDLAMPACLDPKPADVDLEQWYWDLKSLETTVRHAKTILDTLDSNPSTSQAINQIIAQDPSTLKHRLRVIQARIQDALQACPPPTPPISPPLHSRIKPPMPPALPPHLPTSHRPQPDTDAPTIPEDPPQLPPRSSAPDPLLDPPKTVEHLLDQHCHTNEDQMTNELSEMASQLKRNVHHFGNLLVTDREAIEKNATLLKQNEERMRREGGRLGDVTIKGRQMTWFTICAVAGVMVAWFMMFFIIRFS